MTVSELIEELRKFPLTHNVEVFWDEKGQPFQIIELEELQVENSNTVLIAVVKEDI